jgi:hypothetical protein
VANNFLVFQIERQYCLTCYYSTNHLQSAHPLRDHYAEFPGTFVNPRFLYAAAESLGVERGAIRDDREELGRRRRFSASQSFLRQ